MNYAFKFLIASLILMISIASYAQKWDDAFIGTTYGGSPVSPRDMIEYDGELYAAGKWSTTLQSYIAKWDGTSWSAVGTGFIEDTGFDRGIYTLEVFDGELYAGGYFAIDINSTTYRGVAKWNGTSWEQVTDFPYSFSSKVYDFQLWNSNLIFGGEFSGTFGGSTTNVSIIGYNGTNWVEFNEGLTNNITTASVRSIAVHDGELIVAGTFNRDVPTSSFYNKMAKWDAVNQEWVDMSDFFNSGSYNYTKVQSYGDDIYVYAEPVSITNSNYILYKYDFTNTPVSINAVSTDQSNYSVLRALTDMIIYDGNLVVSGEYLDSSFGGQSTPIQIESYDGTTWNRALPEGASASALEVYNGKLITGSAILNDPSVSINATETNLCVDAVTTFSFEDFSSNPISSISWTFDGGTPATSSDESPEVSYAAAGTYGVSVSVTSEDGTTDLTFSDMITVGDVFSVDAGEDVTINYGDELDLVGTPSGGTWSGSDAIQGSTFDGGYSSGEFTITYTVTQNGCTQIDTKVVTVEKNDPGAYDFSAIPDNLVHPVSDGIVLPYISFNLIYTVVDGPATFNTSTPTEPTLNISGAGEITIEVTQPETISTFERTDQHTFTVAKGDHTTTINSIDDMPFGETFLLHFGPGLDFESSAGPGVATGLYDVNILSGPATADNEESLQEITVTGVGTVSFEIVNLGNDNWNPAPTVQGTFEAIKASQTVTASSNISEEYQFSNETLDFSQFVTSSSGLPVVFVISEGPGFFSGDGMDQYNFVSTGQVTLAAFASGNDNYEASPSIEIVFTVIKGDQTVTWLGFDEVGASLPNSITYDPEGYTPVAEADSELDVDYSVVSGDGTIDEGKFLITTSGQFTLRATQAGDDNWNEASLDYTFIVDKAEQTISFEAIEDQVRNDIGFEFVPTSTSGLEVEVSSATGRTSYDGTNVTFNFASAGQEELVLSQQGNSNYFSATQETITFCISAPAPILTIDNQNNGQIEIASDNTIDAHEFFLNGESAGVFSGGFFSFSEAGIYTAVALAGDDCPSSELSNEVVYEVLSAAVEKQIQVYPNPTSKYLRIDANKSIDVSVYGLNGKMYISRRAFEKNESLDISQLPAGQYILQLHEEGKLITSKKIIKIN
jgi:hypothetical protein